MIPFAFQISSPDNTFSNISFPARISIHPHPRDHMQAMKEAVMKNPPDRSLRSIDLLQALKKTLIDMHKQTANPTKTLKSLLENGQPWTLYIKPASAGWDVEFWIKQTYPANIRQRKEMLAQAIFYVEQEIKHQIVLQRVN